MSNISKHPVGVIGSGNFGTVVANLIAQKGPVILYIRSEEKLNIISKTRTNRNYLLHENISLTADMAFFANQCHVIFPVIPSAYFRSTIRELSRFLKPYHILIHGTKGFDIQLPEGTKWEDMPALSRSHVKTMSEVIYEEPSVVRVGCFAGPNLSKELFQNQPSATVIASSFSEVIQTGKKVLKNPRFQVFENDDIIGIEIAGVLKNVIAIAAGALYGLGYGDNAKGLLISRGVVEIVYLGRALGGQPKTFLGVAGIGDLITTCNSHLSRNFTVGNRLAKGEKLDDIIATMNSVAEGVNSVQIAQKCALHYGVKALITDRLYQVLFEDLPVEEALEFLMRLPFSADIDFI